MSDIRPDRLAALRASIVARHGDLRAFLEETAPYVFEDQNHLDEATPERAYWHYGNWSACGDVLAQLSEQNATHADACVAAFSGYSVAPVGPLVEAVEREIRFLEDDAQDMERAAPNDPEDRDVNLAFAQDFRKRADTLRAALPPFQQPGDKSDG